MNFFTLYPSRPSCRSSFRGRFTLHRDTVCRKPRTFGYHDFHMICRYSCQHSHFWYLYFILQWSVVDLQNVLLPFQSTHFQFATKTLFLSMNELTLIENRRFGEILELRYILGATRHRPVSYYAFLKGWLLPSLPPGCLRLVTSFTTQNLLWNLSVRSGLFPFRLETLAPQVCLYRE